MLKCKCCMKILTDPIGEEELKELAKEIDGFYIKIVVDMEKEILAAGSKMHVDEEEMLIENGSVKENLWGGGYDLETKQVAYDSIINNKPGINASSDILDPAIRNKFENILRKILRV